MAFAVNVRVAAPGCDPSSDCFHYLTLDLLPAGEGASQAWTLPSLASIEPVLSVLIAE
jgi:hypothetical protein